MSIPPLAMPQNGELELPPELSGLPLLIAANINISPETGCWIWQGGLRDGYGAVHWEGRPHGIHRVVYTLLVGPIPDGLHLDHVHARGCRSTACCFPGHLEAVTPAENSRRAAELRVPVTSCKRGHPYDEANTYTRPEGTRVCRTCRRERNRRYYVPRPPKTRCKRGHEYTPENTYVTANGSRGCRSCQLQRQRQCSNGHEFTPDNTYLSPTGKRQCVACRKERERLSVERWRATHPILEAEKLMPVLLK